MSLTETKLITRFWQLLKPDRQEIRNLYLFSILSGLLSLGLPLGIQMIINFIELGQLSVSWFVLVFLVVMSIGVSGLLNIFQLRITENLQQRIFTRSAFEFAGRIPNIKLTELFQKYAPDLSNRFFDTLTIQKSLSKLLIDFTAAVLQLLFCLLLLSFYHSFFIFLGIFLLLILALIIRLTAPNGMRTSLEESSYKYKVAAWLKDITHARFSFKLAGSHQMNMDRTDVYVNGYLNARDNHFKVLMKQYGYLILFKILIALCFLILGGILVINQQMNIGQFVASEIIFLLIIGSVEKLILSIEVVYDVLTAIEKIRQVTDLTLENDGGEIMPESVGNGFSVKFERVSFEFEELQQPILINVDLSIEKNEIIGLVSDSSLTSNVLFCLLTGMYEVNKGCVSLNGMPIDNLKKSSYREYIGTYIPQDHLLFDNVIENVRFGRNQYDIGEVEQQLSSLELISYIHSLPNKYHSILNPEVHLLPNDVKIKLLMARALLGRPSLFLAEQPTAGLTSAQKEVILSSLFNSNDKTSLIASNDLEVLSRCPRIIAFKNGQLCFDGNYASYLKFEKTC